MNFKHFLIFGFFFCNTFGLLVAQNSWSLKECIDYAHDHNIQIKQQKLNTEINENTLQQSKLDAFPTLNAGASHNFSFGRALDETTYEFTQNQEVQTSNFSINSSITIFDGFQKWNTIDKNRFSLLASLQDLERIKNDISLNIASAYLQILFNQELVEVSLNQLAITQQQIARTKKLVEAGSLAKGSLLEIQSQEANEELNLVNAKNQLEASYLTLTQLLELDSIGDFDIIRPEFDVFDSQEPLLSIDSTYFHAKESLPRVQGAEYNLKSQKEALDVAKGRRSPSLSLNFSYGTRYSSIRDRIAGFDTVAAPIGYTQPEMETVYTSQPVANYENYPFMDQLQDNANTSLMFRLSIPIFNGWQTNTNISNARVGVLNARYELESVKNRLYKDIQNAHSDARAAWKKYQAAQKTVESMEESFKYTKQKFEVGLVNSVEYNTAKNNLTRAKSERLQAKYEYIFKSKILDFYKGEELTIDE
jgi:outer membrane protein